MARKTTAVATKDDGGVPTYLRDYQGPQNRDNFDESDIVIPRIKLLQALSEEVEAYDEARTGHFWHTGFDKSLGDDIEFVVCSRKKKYLLVAPMEDGQGILARAEDFKTWDRMGSWEVQIKDVGKVTWTIDDVDVVASGLDQWGTFNPGNENSPPAATIFYEYLVILPDHMDLGPAVISLTRSAIKKAKKGLNDKIALHGKANRPMQSLLFRAVAVGDHNADNQTFKNWQFMTNGFADEKIFNAAIDLRDSLTVYRVADEDASIKDATETDKEAEVGDDF